VTWMRRFREFNRADDPKGAMTKISYLALTTIKVSLIIPTTSTTSTVQKRGEVKLPLCSAGRVRSDVTWMRRFREFNRADDPKGAMTKISYGG
jgi:hypothetical protein